MSFEEAVALYQAGSLDAALPALEAYAAENDMAAMLCYQGYQSKGETEKARRALYQAAANGKSGDAALLLAQDYAGDGNWTSALTWAEQAHHNGTPAGELLLRAAEHTGQWEHCTALALAELDMVEDYDRFTLCEALGTVLNGNHISDDKILSLVEPRLSLLEDDPVVYELLHNVWQAAKERSDAQKERAQREAEAHRLQAEADKAGAEARAEAKKRAEQAVKEAEQRKKAKARKTSAIEISKKAGMFLLVLILPPTLNFAAHWVVSSFFPVGFKFFVASAVAGMLISAVGGDIISLVNPDTSVSSFSDLMEYDKDYTLSAIKFSPLCFLLCGSVALIQPGGKLLDMYPYMGLLSVFIQCIRGMRDSKNTF